MQDDRKFAAVLDDLRSLPGAVVGFSGGVDSTVLASLAFEALGERSLAVTARSESLSAEAFEAARRTALAAGFPHAVIGTRELADPRYARNAPDRCFYCKEELVRRLWDEARSRGFGAVLLGNIAEDAADFRPGLEAARRSGARSPLLDHRVTKAEVRSWARSRGLSNWDRPAEACLASRIAYGEPVSADRLSAVERAEAAVRELSGVRRLRVRLHGQIARIEVDAEEIPAILPARGEIERRLRALGFAYVTLDLAGYRTGSLNRTLSAKSGE